MVLAYIINNKFILDNNIDVVDMLVCRSYMLVLGIKI